MPNRKGQGRDADHVRIIQEQQLMNVFTEGGIGFGSFRGQFGKFEVVLWE